MTKTNLSTTIDGLGEVRAQIADLELQEKALKEALKELEPGAYEGELFRLVITTPERTFRDDDFKEAIEELIEEHFSRQYIKAHTSVRPIRTLRVSARTGKNISS